MVLATIQLIESSLGVITTIVTTVERVSANRQQLGILASRARIFSAPLQSLRTRVGNSETDGLALQRLHSALMRAEKLVGKNAERGFIEHAIKAKWIAEEIEDITRELQTARDDLNFEITIATFNDMEAQLAAARDDVNKLQAQIEDMIYNRDNTDTARLWQQLAYLRWSAGDEIVGFTEVPFETLKFASHGDAGGSTRLGRGSFGEVRQASYHDVQVAIKQLPEGCLTRQEVDEFRREIKLHSRLNFPLVVQLLGACTVEPNFCMVLELAQESLFDLLHRPGSGAGVGGRPGGDLLPWNVKVAMMWDVTRAVAFLHTIPLLHRDLKSPNVLVFDNLQLKVCDFGLSKVKEATRRTHTFNGGGTTAWAPPETFEVDRPFDTASDVYSMAMVIYEVLTGNVPFHHLKKEAQIIHAVCYKQSRPDMSSCASNSDLPGMQQIAQLVQQGWQHDPRRRPSAEEMSRSIGNVVNGILGGDPRSAKKTPPMALSGLLSSAQAASTRSSTVETEHMRPALSCAGVDSLLGKAATDRTMPISNAPTSTASRNSYSESAAAESNKVNFKLKSREPSDPLTFQPCEGSDRPSWSSPPQQFAAPGPQPPRPSSADTTLAKVRTARDQRDVQELALLLTAHKEAAEVQAAGCAAVAKLVHADASIAAALARSALPKLIADAMARWPEDVAVQRQGCQAMRYMARNVELGVVLSKAGGCAVVAAGMRRFPADAAIQSAGCWAVRYLAGGWGASDNGQLSRAKLAEQKAGVLVAAAMAACRSDGTVQEVGCMAIEHLARDGRSAVRACVQQPDVVAQVVAAMRQHPSAALIQQRAACALSHLAASGGGSYRVQMGAAGVGETLATCLRAFPACAEMAKQACIALNHLATEASNRDALRAVGVVVKHRASKFNPASSFSSRLGGNWVVQMDGKEYVVGR